MNIVGKVFKTKNYGEFIVTKYDSCDGVHVKFINTGYETVSQVTNVKEGTIRDRLAPSVMGVGVIGEAQVFSPKKYLQDYMVWFRMLQRCYSENRQTKQPTYKGCTVSDNFKYFPYFKDWCVKQVGFGVADDNLEQFALDKDILVRGNKVYSEDTCVFVPREINMIIVTRKSRCGGLPVGVYFYKPTKKYKTQLSMNGKRKSLGYYKTPEEAFLVYKQAKESYIKEVANKWKGQVDVRVYEALMDWKVAITD